MAILPSAGSSIPNGLSRSGVFPVHCLAEGEVALGAVDVAADLFAEGFWVGPADLGAEAA